MTKSAKDSQLSGVKAKLTAVVCMLLVAVIMVVSSTYAWFTLSTAPEVTGITTAVGANGALEIALLPESGLVEDIVTAINSTAAFRDKNVTWGNLVDLSDDEFYGLNQIMLYPSKLNAILDENGNPTSFTDSILSTPKYGADGRVSELASNTSTSVLENGKFTINGKSGVRAIGVASGLSDRQLAYRNARSAAATAMAQAKTKASTSLSSNGNAVANIAIQHAAADGTETYTDQDVAALLAIVNDLVKEDGVFDKIEEATMQYIIAFAASGVKKDGGSDEQLFDNNVYATVTNMVKEAESLDDLITKLSNVENVNVAEKLPASITSIHEILYGKSGTPGAIEKANTAKGELEQLSGSEITWSQLSTPLNRLVSTTGLTVNGIPVNQIKEKMSDLISSVASGQGLVVSMPTGTGVYADIADICGDYSAEIKIKNVSYGGLTLESMDAKMSTATTVKPPHLSQVSAMVEAAGSPAGDAEADVTKPMSEFYGYIIDLAFRTNASESNLLLQDKGIDRIYSTNGNEETLGKGSTMSFESTSPTFKVADVKALMENIRIVFFTPGTDGNTVLATAKLDVAGSTTEGTEVTAAMYLYTMEYSKDASGNYLDAGGNIVYHYNSADSSYYEEAELTTKVDSPDMTKVAVKETKLEGEKAVITALTQNVAQKVSVLVYLDGETIQNKDVAATGTSSMTGKMNLQFASSATLTPMEYSDLHIQDSTVSEPTESQP